MVSSFQLLRAAQALLYSCPLSTQKHLTAWVCGSGPRCQGREFREVGKATAPPLCPETRTPEILQSGPFSFTASVHMSEPIPALCSSSNLIPTPHAP